jgi:hypothetical protein
MAQQAIGRNCPNDGTLTACAGSYADEFLVGTCAYCKNTVSVENPYYSATHVLVEQPVIPAGYKLVPIDEAPVTLPVNSDDPPIIEPPAPAPLETINLEPSAPESAPQE